MFRKTETVRVRIFMTVDTQYRGLYVADIHMNSNHIPSIGDGIIVHRDMLTQQQDKAMDGRIIRSMCVVNKVFDFAPRHEYNEEPIIELYLENSFEEDN